MFSWTLWLAVFGISCSAAPIDSPVRVDLPVYDQPKGASESDAYDQSKGASELDANDQSKGASGGSLANPLEIENHPSPQKVDNAIVGGFLANNNIFGHKLESSTPQVGSINYPGGLFSPPVTSLEGALLETEGLGSKTLSFKENIQGVVAGIFQPQPILDTIKEEEKYGNEGDKFYSAGRAIVNSASGVSQFVNSILEVPGNLIRKIARTATEKLNYLGGKIVGL